MTNTSKNIYVIANRNDEAISRPNIEMAALQHIPHLIKESTTHPEQSVFAVIPAKAGTQKGVAVNYIETTSLASNEQVDRS